MRPVRDDELVATIVHRAETYADLELMLQAPSAELTHGERQMLIAGIYLGVGATFDEIDNLATAQSGRRSRS